MNRIKSNILKSLVVIALMAPAAFADGDMGSGGFADSDVPVPVKTSPRTTEDGDMGSGGRSSTTDDGRDYLDWMLSSVCEYFDWTM